MENGKYYAEHGSIFSPASPGLPGIIGRAQHTAIDAAYGKPGASETGLYHDPAEFDEVPMSREEQRKHQAYMLGELSVRNSDLIEMNEAVGVGEDGTMDTQAIINDIASGADKARFDELVSNVGELDNRLDTIRNAKYTAKNILTAGSVVRGIKKRLGHTDSVFDDDRGESEYRYKKATRANLQQPGVMEAIVETARQEAAAAGVQITSQVDIAKNIRPQQDKKS